MQRYGVLVAFLVLFAASAIWQPEHFLKAENLRNLVSQNVPVGIVAVGMTLVIIAGGIDLSVGSILVLSAAIGLWSMNKMIGIGQSEAVAVAAGSALTVLSGSALGALNGIIIVWGRVAPFIATLAGLVAYRSVCVALADGSEIRSSSPDLFTVLGTDGVQMPFLKNTAGEPLEFTWAMMLFIVCALFGGFLLNWTRFGRYSIAVGANEKAAKYSAVPVGRTKVLTYTFLGFLTGVAGLTLASRMNSVASSNLGQLYELDAIAAVVIGGTSLRGGSGKVWGTVVGVLLLGIITNILVVAGVSAYWQGLVKGGIILVAVLIQRGRE
jgi:ribose transport system permease protein